MVSAVSRLFKRPWLNQLYLFAIGLLILFLRRPDALTTPQFWGEDGRFWYADAYNDGSLSSLFLPYAGSLQLAMRLVASVVVHGPFRYAPLMFALSAVVIKLLPALLLNTKRFSRLIPNVRVRLLIIFFYLLIPSSFEVHANLTNINWHLTLLAFMVVVAKPSRAWLWRSFDFAVIIISGLTGPFSIILSLVALWKHRFRRDFQSKPTLYALVVCACIQIFVLIFGPDNSRLAQPLEPSLSLLLKIIGSRIGTSTIIGSNLAGRLIAPESWLNIVAGMMVLVITGAAFVMGKYPLRYFIFFTWAMLAAAMIKPQASDTMPQWHALLVGAGSRYFFLPILCFFVCLVFLAISKKISNLARTFASTLVISACAIGIPVDFRYPPQNNMSFHYFENEFRSVPVGQTYCLPINPGWNMCLNKHL